MFGSGILDTVIGLVFVFLLVSMMVTIINEMLAAFLKSRAKWLRVGIGRLLDLEWMEQFYAHPLIEGTTRKEKAWFIERGPSYIPSRSFANVLMSIIQDKSKAITQCQEVFQKALEGVPNASRTLPQLRLALSTGATQMQTAGGISGVIAADLGQQLDASFTLRTRLWLEDLEAIIAPLPANSQFSDVLQRLMSLARAGRSADAIMANLSSSLDTAITKMPDGETGKTLKEQLRALSARLTNLYNVADACADIHLSIEAMPVEYVRQIIEMLPADGVRKSLLTLFDDAKNDVEKFKQNIEVWFNNGMDRVNGWYKRRSQLVIFFVAALVTVAMNVDAINIFRHLQTYPALSEAMVGQATQYARSSAAVSKDAPQEGQADLVKQFNATQTQLTGLAIPIGWVRPASEAQKADGLERPLFNDLVGILSSATDHALGWLLTALAATLGAPFWFDMLNRIISIRAAGKPPEEDPKPPKSVSVAVEPGQTQQEADRLK